MSDISLIYGYSLLLLGLIISLYAVLKQLVSYENRPFRGISQSKWNQLALFAFLSISFMGTCLLFIDIIWKEAITHRLSGMPFGELFDIIIIGHIFFAFLLIITRVRLQKVGDRPGQFVVEIKSKYEFFLLILFLPTPSSDNIGYLGSIIFLLFYMFMGGSSLLLFLALIPIILTKFIFETAPAH